MARFTLLVMLAAACGFPKPPDVADVIDDGCVLTSIAPALAEAGETVFLEGTFGETVAVRFPGAAPVLATVLGTHRASVVVPAIASEGGVTVTTCTATLGPLPFRRSAFKPGLGVSSAIYDQSAHARQTPSLVTARQSATASVVDGHVWVVGGAGPSGPVASIERAQINADSTVGRFLTASSLVVARAGHTATPHGGSLYVVGGLGATALGSVERVTLGSSEATAEIVESSALVTPRHRHAAVVVGNYLYVLGGLAGGPLDGIERAPLLADGAIGRFEAVEGVHLAVARHGHSASVVGGFLYVVGGTGTGGALGSVERAAIGGDGSLGPFALDGVALLVPRTGHVASLLGGALYVSGGAGAGGPLDSTEATAITTQGLLEGFTTMPSVLARARVDAASVIVGNHQYLLGGSSGSALAGIERSTLALHSRLDTQGLGGRAVAAPRAGSALAVVANVAYLIGGGLTPSASVESASIRPNAELGNFGPVLGVSLVTARRRHIAAVVGSDLYVLGGVGAAGTLASIERAGIRADGTLTTFTPAGALTVARAGHTSVVLGGYLYVIGGVSGSSQLASVERAAIQPDGSLGAFAIVNGVTLTASSAGAGNQSVVARDALYIFGPSTAGVARAAIAADGSLGTFVDVGNVVVSDPERFEASATLLGQQIYLIGGESQTSAIDEIFPLTPTGVLGSSAVLRGIPRRHGHGAVVLGNVLYLLGGVDAAGSAADPSVVTVPLR